MPLIAMKEWASLDHQQLYRLICRWLSLPPASAGKRLLSERDLCLELGIPRKRLRNCLDRLIGEGIIVPRHGSGNYLRRIPRVNEKEADWDERPPIRLFASDNVPPKLELRPEQKRLRIAVWSGFHRQPSPNRSILDGIREEAAAMGHEVSFQNIYTKNDELLDVEALCRRLKSEPADGHLVSYGIGDLFREALERAVGESWLRTSVVYVAPFFAPVTCQPMVRLDTLEAIERAVHIFHEAGYRRIALIAVDSAYHDTDSDLRCYQAAMAAHGLDYRAWKVGPIDVAYAHRAVGELLAEPEPPEAIYVGNDKIIDGVARALRESSKVPGRDLGLIAFTNRDNPVALRIGWSSLEFDPSHVGRIAFANLIREIETAQAEVHSISLLARWIPGRTHRPS